MEDSVEYKGYTIEIVQDEDAENPRTAWDNLCVMVCWHRRYNLGDSESWKAMDGKHKSQQLSENYSESIDLLYELAGIERGEYQSEHDDEDMTSIELFQAIEAKDTIISPLYLYDHSGITISMGGFSCPWDSGQVGYIYIDKATIVENWGDTPEAYEKAKKCMEGEVETYDDYLVGSVYGYRILDSEGEDTGESCYGYYGYDHEKSDLLPQAKSVIGYLLENKKETV